MLAVRRWGIVCAPPQSLPSFSFFLTLPPLSHRGLLLLLKFFVEREARAAAEGEALQHCVAAGRKAREEAGSPPPPPPFQAARGETQLCPCALLPSFLPPSLPPRLLPMELSNGAVGRNGGGGVRLKRCFPPIAGSCNSSPPTAAAARSSPWPAKRRNGCGGCGAGGGEEDGIEAGGYIEQGGGFGASVRPRSAGKGASLRLPRRRRRPLLLPKPASEAERVRLL